MASAMQYTYHCDKCGLGVSFELEEEVHLFKIKHHDLHLKADNFGFRRDGRPIDYDLILTLGVMYPEA